MERFDRELRQCEYGHLQRNAHICVMVAPTNTHTHARTHTQTHTHTRTHTHACAHTHTYTHTCTHTHTLTHRDRRHGQPEINKQHQRILFLKRIDLHQHCQGFSCKRSIKSRSRSAIFPSFDEERGD